MSVIIYLKNGEVDKFDFISEIVRGDMGRIILTRHGLQSATWVYHDSMIDKIEIR